MIEFKSGAKIAVGGDEDPYVAIPPAPISEWMRAVMRAVIDEAAQHNCVPSETQIGAMLPPV